MHRVIVPDNLRGRATAFFTGKDPGSDKAAISALTGMPMGLIYLPIQKHTDRVQVVRARHEQAVADAVVTVERDLLLGVQVADCVPILLFDPVRRAAGAVHAGWRGTVATILIKTVSVMVDRFFCDPRDMYLAIGPSIRGCCYAVGPEVSRAVSDASGAGRYLRTSGDRQYIDLAEANRVQAHAAGIPRQNIWVSEDCTCCSPERFFSYRYSGGSTGRQAGFIGNLR